MSGLEHVNGGSERKQNLADRAFKGLPIPGVKKEVAEIVAIDKEKETIAQVLSGELKIVAPSKKGRNLNTHTQYYIYNLQLEDGQEIEVMFYPYDNKKVLVGVGKYYEEVNVNENSSFLMMINKIYSVPVYTQERNGGVRLIALS